MNQTMMFDTPRTILNEDIPAYKVKKYGVEYLSYRDLLAVIIGSAKALDIADKITMRWGQPIKLLQADVYDLASIKGVGEATARKIKAALQLGVTVAKDRYIADNNYKIGSPDDIANLFRVEMSAHTQEVVKIVTLDTRNVIINDHDLYKGTKNSQYIKVGEIYRVAITDNAAGIIVMHNHPSGDPQPSSDDISLTKHLSDAGKALDIDFLDHIVIGGGSYKSIRQAYSSAFLDL